MAMKFYTRFQNPHLTSAKIFFSFRPFLLALISIAWAVPLYAHGPEEHKGVFNEAEPVHSPMESEKELEKHFGSKANLIGKGRTAYQHMCKFCHGEDGNGGGKATAYLYPWPRDFRKGVFKFHSTPSGSLPLDKDIFRAISRGIPGTAMPAWRSSLTEDEIWALVAYIKTFSKRFQSEEPKAPINVGTPPSVTPEMIQEGEGIFAEMRCGRCHGTDLKGSGKLADNLFDIWDHRSFVYDLTDPNLYKWGSKIENIYLTLTAGVDGTPMKSYNHLTDPERWALAAYVESKINRDKFQLAQYETDLKVEAVDVEEIPLDPNKEIWKDIPVKEVHLLPLNARKHPVNRIRFQALVNDESIAFRLQWDDPTPNKASSRHQDFKDSVALEFALGDVMLHTHGHNEPFFGMGNRGKVVNIWQWRADWQQDIETKKELEYATKGMDVDGMIFGGEVNPVDALNPFREVPVEELNAEGFGTLTAQPGTKQNVQANGVWENGKWTVVLSRPLDSLNKWDIKFDKKTHILIAFAVWDGAYRDVDGRKMVAMWQRLHMP